MSWFKSSNFDWINLINQSSLDELINTSFENKVLLFKHSTRCSISSLAKSRIESVGDNRKIKNCYYLDLLAFRLLSNKISLDFNKRCIGKVFNCLIDRKEGVHFVGRTFMDSPDVDNEVLVDATKYYLKQGDFVDVKIIKASDYDLIGVPI